MVLGLGMDVEMKELVLNVSKLTGHGRAGNETGLSTSWSAGRDLKTEGGGA